MKRAEKIKVRQRMAADTKNEDLNRKKTNKQEERRIKRKIKEIKRDMKTTN